MKVLIVKTSSMGDIIHTLPALTDAANQFNNISFDWVVEENFVEIPSWHHAVDLVIPVAIRRWRKNWFARDIVNEKNEFYQKLTAQKYDAIIDAQGLIKSAFLIVRKGYGKKHGYNWRNAKEPIASLFYDSRHNIPYHLHAVERIRQLFAKSLQYPLPNEKGSYAIKKHFLSNLPDDNNQYLVFLHTTTADYKHWTESAWRELISFIQPTGLKVKLPWGAPHEKERAIRLSSGFSHVEVLPKLQLRQIASVLSGARAVVSVDTGLSHLTAALGRPNITLFGKTDPKLVGGYGKNQYIIVGHNHSINNIDVNDVYKKLMSIIQ